MARAGGVRSPSGAACGLRSAPVVQQPHVLPVVTGLVEATRNAWCREQGLYPAELDGWKRDAIGGLGEPRGASVADTRQDRRRIKELERELHRKDKALAETAALLVLSKKLPAIFHKGEDV